MAFTFVGSAAAVTQLIGQAAGLISMIGQAVETARQNKLECDHLERHVSTVHGVLSSLRDDPEAVPPLAELINTLEEAHQLVLSCQRRSTADRFFRAGRHADTFRDLNARIISDISVLSLRLLTLIANHTGVPAPGSSSGSPHTQMVLSHVSSFSSHCPRTFTWAEIAVATNDFADELGGSCSWTVYKGRLHDGPEVAVKVMDKQGRDGLEDAFVPVLVISFRLRHDHIVRLVGWCAEEDDRMLVYEHMSNGTLRDRLQRAGGGSSSSAATAPWRTRVAVLLGVSWAIQYLHCGAEPVVIHRNVSSSNILLDMNWTPRLSGFGAAVYQAAGEEHGGQLVEEVVGTPGYIDPEYSRTKRVSTASDVYSFGVVMLEALTGEDPAATLQLDSIRNGKLALKDALDRRPSLDPTLPQMEALEIVADTAKRCICLSRMGRPDMSKVVANLEEALVVIRSHEPMSMARLSLIRRRTSEN
ncbi:probable serine/threonine-protein kinase PBL21 [Triticum dicoccoides]|uniref:probable serine/threonine-protein kinase PBL21 n=1 Tax=Triticum dicoccoides TaxID=85692 RepID=UPI00188DD784|nr:probable serine/threonine-protein kinase PBL21 [Triticum dicoccoides]